MTAKKIFTLADARDQKRDAELPALARAEAAMAERNARAMILNANPEIGMLVVDGGLSTSRNVYYAFLDGYDQPATRADHPQALADALAAKRGAQ
jgi:hypothetical protein